MRADYLPPIRTSPPDELTIVAAEFHDVLQHLASQYGQPESGIPWTQMPLSYQQCLRHVFQILFEHETIRRNYWR